VSEDSDLKSESSLPAVRISDDFENHSMVYQWRTKMDLQQHDRLKALCK
jgi:hypothetical protein